MVPLLEGMFPKEHVSQPKIDVPPSEAEERTLRIVQSFLACVVFDDRPLVIFIDDIQWSSDAETNLLTQLISSFKNRGTATTIRNCLLIVSYRVNELPETASKKLEDAVQTVRRSVGTEIRGAIELQVGPLQLVLAI